MFPLATGSLVVGLAEAPLSFMPPKLSNLLLPPPPSPVLRHSAHKRQLIRPQAKGRGDGREGEGAFHQNDHNEIAHSGGRTFRQCPVRTRSKRRRLSLDASFLGDSLFPAEDIANSSKGGRGREKSPLLCISLFAATAFHVEK